MSRSTVRAWLRTILLVPVVFALAIAAVSLAAGVIPARQPAGDRSHPPGPVAEDQLSPPSSARFLLPVVLPAAGGEAALIAIRITTDPPAPEVLDASREYLTTLVQTLVRTLPANWSPDESGVAILKRAIEEAVPASLAAKLPAGTRVTVSADVTVTGAPGAPPGSQTPAVPQAPASPPSP
jgi:hypothetical protein